MKQEIKIFLASSIVAFEEERIAIGAFVERMIQAYRPQGIYIKLYRCEDETFAYAAEGAQEYLNAMVNKSDLVLVLVRDTLGSATKDEIRHATDHGVPLLFLVQADMQIQNEGARTAVCQALQGSALCAEPDVLREDNCLWFNSATEVCSHLLHILVQRGLVEAPQWMRASDGMRWLSYAGYTLLPEKEIVGHRYWDDAEAVDCEVLPPKSGVNRVFVVTAPGVNDGDDLLNFVRTLNDIYRFMNIDFEAFAFSPDRLDPNATDETAANSVIFLLLGRENGEDSAKEMLDGAIEAYRAHLDADGDGLPKILTYFEKVEDVPDTMASMQKHLSDIGHYYSKFESLDSVKFWLAVELARLFATNDLFLNNGRLCSKDGTLEINLNRVPIFENNKMLQRSIKELKDIDKRLKNVSGLDLTQEGQELKHAQTMFLSLANDIERQLLNVAQRISKLWDGGDLSDQDERMRVRICRVKELFDEGNYEAVIDLLTSEEYEQELAKDLENMKRRDDMHEEDIVHARQIINERMILVSAIKLRGIQDDDVDTIVDAYERCMSFSMLYGLDFEFLEPYTQLLWHRERHEQAIKVCNRVIDYFDNETAERKRNGERETSPHRFERARTLRQMADVLDNDSDKAIREQAVKYAKEALGVQLWEIKTLEYYGEPRSEDLEIECARTKNSLGVYSTHLKRYEDAYSYGKDALLTFEHWNDHGTRDYREILGKAYNNVAFALDNLGRFDEAVEYHENSLRIRRADDGVGPVDREHYVAYSLNSYATHHFKLGAKHAKEGDVRAALESYAKAEKLHREALAIRSRYEKDNYEQFAPRLAATRHNLAGCIVRQVELDKSLSKKETKARLLEAKDLLTKALTVREDFEAKNPTMYSKVAQETRDLLDTCLRMLDDCDK